MYEVDYAMCGPEFKGDVRDVARYLTNYGYDAVAITLVNGASNAPGTEPPEQTWLNALAYAEQEQEAK